MGCSGCLALVGVAFFGFGIAGALLMVKFSDSPVSAGEVVLGVLINAGLGALCLWALAKKRRPKWYRRM